MKALMEANERNFILGGAMSNVLTESNQMATVGEFYSTDSVQEGLQDLSRLSHPIQTTHFSSSNDLLVDAKWLHQKRHRRLLLSSALDTHSSAYSRTYDSSSLPSNDTHEGMKLFIQRETEGVSQATDGPLSAMGNGSNSTSPEQAARSDLYGHTFDSSKGAPFKACTQHDVLWCSHPQVLSEYMHAATKFLNGMSGFLNGPFVKTNRSQDMIWRSHQEVPNMVLVPSFLIQNSANQSQGASRVEHGKTKPRMRARRGQATDPHSIAERIRRERITERIRLLQELVPNTNKADRAIMLDEIIEYVKFLVVQVKVLSMNKLVNDSLILQSITFPQAKDTKAAEEMKGEASSASGESLLAMEEYVAARLMTNDVGAALRFLQDKGLCLVPISYVHSRRTNIDASLSATTQLCPSISVNTPLSSPQLSPSQSSSPITAGSK
ncbi:hypothetical protein KP509_04G038900 [Ceratopteris richardii]|uniref:BHLH domain-containing protein n=2 Tax=Ceratopteris richardii TaxID=49495 RepID=A0A8T2UZR1_CERRI|nr:hypothetical protein KP509_04G038900 [Ceratopteris richardii]